MRHEDEHVLALRHLHHVRRAADVVDLAVGRMLLDQRLARLARRQPEQRLRDEQVVVAAENAGEDLLVRHDQEVLVRVAPRHFVVVGACLQRIAAAPTAAAVNRREDVDAGRARRLEIGQPHVEPAHLPQPLHRAGVEVRRHHLIAGQRLVAILARERERRLQRRLAGSGADVEEHRHPLPGAGPRAVEREVLAGVFGAAADRVRLLFLLGLADADRERRRTVLAIPVVAEVELGFARPEEAVRRRERGDRAAGPFGDDQAVARLQRHRRRRSSRRRAGSPARCSTCRATPRATSAESSAP